MTDTERNTLEAQARALESKAAVLRGRDAEGAAQAEAELADVTAQLRDASAEPLDLSGTAPTLSDSMGNFAPTPEVARVGGIGVVASNSTEAGEQAQAPEEVDLSGALEPVTAPAVASAPELPDATREALEAQGKIEPTEEPAKAKPARK